MKLAIAAGAALILGAGTAWAQPATELRDLLAVVPASQFQSAEPILAYFVSPGALDALAPADEFDADTALRFEIGAGFPALEALAFYGSPESWAGHTGISGEAVAAFLSVGEPPAQMMLWLLRSAADADTVMATLPSQGFTPVDDAILGNGEPRIVNIERARDRANPWADALGRATFVAAREATLVQAPDPVLIAPYLADAAKAVDDPAVAAALDAINALPSGAAVIQALLVSPALGLDAGAEGHLLPYRFGILFDADIGGTPNLGITLVYADCPTAAGAAKAVVTAWQTDHAGDRTFAERVPAEATIVVGAERDGACAATALLAVDTDTARNPAFRLAVTSIFRREFSPLRIATDPATPR